MTGNPFGQPWSLIGGDPGGTCGLAWGTYSRYKEGVLRNPPLWDLRAASCDPEAYFELLEWKLRTWGPQGENRPVVLFVELFVTAGRNKSVKAADADATRQRVEQSRALATKYGVPVKAYPAAAVKPWASDKRLEVVGFPLAPKLKDARDAGRHLIYGAFKHGIADDPLY